MSTKHHTITSLHVRNHVVIFIKLDDMFLPLITLTRIFCNVPCTVLDGEVERFVPRSSNPGIKPSPTVTVRPPIHTWVNTPSEIAALDSRHDPLDRSSDSGSVQVRALGLTNGRHDGPYRRTCPRAHEDASVVLCQVEDGIDKFDWNTAAEVKTHSLDV